MRSLRTHHKFYSTFAEMKISEETIAPIARPAVTRNLDHRFFAGMALVIVATVFLGFARTYFLAGMFHAKLPSLLVHVHAVLFSSWIIFLIVQIWLVSAGHIGWHRQLGIFGAVLALAMVVLGLLTATQSFARGFSPPGSRMVPGAFYAFPVVQILTFCVLFAAAFLLRFEAAAHKRLMLIATFSLLGPAINRWPFRIIHKIPPLTPVIILLLVGFLAAFDLWTRRKIHRATLSGGALLAASQFAMFPIGQSQIWLHFTDWMLKLWSGGN